jgi:hypothetical protein
LLQEALIPTPMAVLKIELLGPLSLNDSAVGAGGGASCSAGDSGAAAASRAGAGAGAGCGLLAARFRRLANGSIAYAFRAISLMGWTLSLA